MNIQPLSRLLPAALALLVAGCGDDFPTVLNLDDSGDQEFTSDAPLYGTITDNYGEPIAGVLVSDGIQTTETNADGNYQLFTDLSARRFVHVTVPAGFEVPFDNGIPRFYQAIPSGQDKFKADFMLNRMAAAPDRYTILMTADPQIRQSTVASDNYMFHSNDIYQDLCTDMKLTAAAITDRPVYSICLGDMIHNNMTLWPDYLAGIADFPFPVFHVIGNHDHVQNAPRSSSLTDVEAVSEYEKHLGPVNYAVDLGKIHYIFLDNIIMQDNSALSASATGSYLNGLDEEAVEWLRGHLAHVGKDKILMVCGHTSFYKKLGYDPASSDQNATVYTNLFAGYKFVHSWAGHNHEYYNYAYAAEEASSKYPNVESHILGRATGMLGLNAAVTSDGVPRGYLVIDVDGENISWQFKPTDYELGAKLPSHEGDGQICMYYPNQAYRYDDGYVYANVYNYDAHWGPVYYSDNGGANLTPMTQVLTHDGYANYLYVGWKDIYTALSYTTTPHMFRIEPSAGATSATVEVTDRFGNRYTDAISW